MPPIGHTQLAGSTVPQHATFAHSKEDVLNALSFYFGQPTSPEKLKDYNEHHAATCALHAHSGTSPPTSPPTGNPDSPYSVRVVRLQITSRTRIQAPTPRSAT